MSSTLYFKLTNKNEYHHNYQYDDGLNTLEGNFNDDFNDSYGPGRFYFSNGENICKYLNSESFYLREVFIPDNDLDFKMIKNETYFGANKIILGKRYSLNDVDTLKYMISNKINIRAGNDTLIKWYCQKGQVDGVDFLLSRNIPVDIEDNCLIQIASFNKQLEFVKLLVTRGADPKSNNNRCIRWAAENGDLEMVKYLIFIGCDPFTNNNCVIQLATRYGHYELVKWLCEYGVNPKSRNSLAIRWAAKYGHKNIVQYLIQIGAYINVDLIGAIKWSIENKQYEIIKLLIPICSHTKYFSERSRKLNKTDIGKKIFKIESSYLLKTGPDYEFVNNIYTLKNINILASDNKFGSLTTFTITDLKGNIFETCSHHNSGWIVLDEI
ncbi:repeat protein [Moumouvirus goulette]|uniref:Repeat protein n=1 Tax=Moumouvirus goulette TaxID=1247379 RepID=M1NMP7_9VIRU|nr:repeat protein [Moumouvirus goulette]AGF85320.1 repeat protein [Moumouvirus goulette]